MADPISGSTEVNQFDYVVWFRDTTCDPDDQDYEWPACFLILSRSVDAAKNWGDHLARRYSEARRTEVYLWSECRPHDPSLSVALGRLPVVIDGVNASDDEIGW